MNNQKLEILDEEGAFWIGCSAVQPLKKRLASKRSYFLKKRILDIIGALIGCIITVPFIFLVGLAIKLEDKCLSAKVFFVQERVGKDGKVFKMIKFRSMHKEAESHLVALLDQNEVKGAMFKMKNDPRVTKVGKFIRKTSIDELPQFFNVLVGNMSLVGPRPPLLREVRQYKDTDKVRLLVKPGITGLWQATVRNNVDFEDVVKLDLQYINHLSMMNDIKILLKTIWIVLHPNDAY